LALDDWLLWVHIGSAATWFGAGALTLLLSSKARSEGSLYSFVKQMEWVGPKVGPVAVVGVLGSGIWMVIRRGGYEFSDAWIVGGIVGFAILVAIGAGFHNRQYKKVNQAAAEHGESSPQVAKLFNGSVRGAQVEVVLLIAVLWLMVFKPGF
jgi:uncharacterized membrane protein